MGWRGMEKDRMGGDGGRCERGKFMGCLWMGVARGTKLSIRKGRCLLFWSWGVKIRPETKTIIETCSVT